MKRNLTFALSFPFEVASIARISKRLAPFFLLSAGVLAAGGNSLSITPVKITRHPASQIVGLSTKVTLRVSAIGSAPFTYQWFFNAAEVVGETNNALLFTNISWANAGLYQAVVMNGSETATSRVARVDVYVRSGIFDIADPVEFSKILSTNAVITKHATVDSWIEGPVWIPDGGYLVFSDIGNNRLKKLVPPSTLTDFLKPPPETRFNGNLLDLHENLISCQAGSAGLRVVMTTNGVSVPLLSTYTNGLKFYSPNDLAVRSDGAIWFTDAGYDSGLPLPPPNGTSIPRGFQPGLYVYAFSTANGQPITRLVATNLSRPNGICFSPDETKFYVSDTVNAPGVIRVYDATSSGVTDGAVFCTVANGGADGIKSDIEGRIWSSAGDGVEIFAPDGHMIGRIRTTRTANLCFGGPDYKTLYMVGQPSVSSIPVLVPGAVAIKRLTASLRGNTLAIRWNSPSTGYFLQQFSLSKPEAGWTDVSTTPSTHANMKKVGVPLDAPAMLFRLQLR